jgi:hypothetical protein
MIAKVLKEREAFDVLKREKLSEFRRWDRVVGFTKRDDDLARIWEAPNKLLIVIALFLLREWKVSYAREKDISLFIHRFTLAVLYKLQRDTSLSCRRWWGIT